MMSSLRFTFCLRYEENKLLTNAARHILLMIAMSTAIAVAISGS